MAESLELQTLTIRCPSCSRKGAVPLSAALPRPSCPGCGDSLPLHRPIDVAEADFTSTVLRAPVPVLVDFYASWCAPCRWLDPILEGLAAQWRGRVLVTKVDTEEAPRVTEDQKVGSVPTVVLFRDGIEVGRSIGVEPDVLNDLVEGVA